MTEAAGRAATVDVAPRTDAVRLAILTGRDPGLLAAAHAAALGACADVVLELTHRDHASLTERAAAIRDARPEIVLFVADGGDADEMVDLAEAVRLALEAQDPPATLLIHSAERTHARAEAAAGRAMEAIADPRAEQGRVALVARLRTLAAGADVRHCEAVERAAGSLATAAATTVAIVDVASATTSIAIARADGTTAAAHLPIGVAAAADRVVVRGGLDRVRRWIPRAIDAPALLERVFNRTCWPEAAPETELTVSIEMALARECIARLVTHASRAGLAITDVRTAGRIVASGRLAALAPVQAVLVVLDAVAPEGVVLIARETPDSPLAGGGRETQALALSATPLRRTASLHLADASGTIDERVARGMLARFPTTGAVRLTVDGANAQADELAVGVVIDARGRPLELPPRDAERLPALARWYGALDVFPDTAAAG